MDILVSVCITAYNVAPYIAEAIEGALKQETSFPFEIIIGDDGSTDETRNICLSYQQKYPDKIVLVLHDENVGVAKNDISVVNKARGKYLAWCDGDDYWIDSNKLQAQCDILEKNDDVALVLTDWVDYIESDNIFSERKFVQTEKQKTSTGVDGINLLVLGQTIGYRFSSSMFRKPYYLDALEKDPDLFLLGHYNNDIAVFVAMHERGNFFHLPQITTVYRIRKESLSISQNDKKRYIYAFKYFKFVSHVIKTYHLPQSTMNFICRNLLYGLLKTTYYGHIKEDSVEIKNIASSLDYKLTIIMKLLYLGSQNKLFFYITKPMFDFNYKFLQKAK